MLLLGIAVFVLWFMDILSNEKFTMGLAGIGLLGGTVIGYFGKDASSSHTHDIHGTVNPDPPTPPPPPNK